MRTAPAPGRGWPGSAPEPIAVQAPPLGGLPSAQVDRYTNSADGPNDTDPVLTAEAIGLAAGETGHVTLSVDVPDDAELGDELTVTAQLTSEATQESVATAIVTITVVAEADESTDGSLSVTPDPVRAGETIAASGDGFAPGSPVNVWIEPSVGDPLDAVADDHGRFSVEIAVPSDRDGTLVGARRWVRGDRRAAVSTGATDGPSRPGRSAGADPLRGGGPQAWITASGRTRQPVSLSPAWSSASTWCFADVIEAAAPRPATPVRHPIPAQGPSRRSPCTTTSTSGSCPTGPTTTSRSDCGSGG